MWNIERLFLNVAKKEQPLSLTIEVARKILDASKQRAQELRSPVSIAIVDAGGHLVLFERGLDQPDGVEPRFVLGSHGRHHVGLNPF